MIDFSVPKELFNFIDSYDKFVICGHKEPDGDCLGSQLALQSFLRRKRKTALCVNPGPFNRPEIETLEPLFSSGIDPDFGSGGDTAVIITDCSTIERIGDLREQLEPYPLAVIDHHSSGEEFGAARYVVPEAASTTMLIYRMFREAGLKPEAETAEYLLFGLATDTGFFRHTESGSREVFDITAELVEAGASPNRIHRRIFGSRTLKSRQLLGVLLGRTESHYEGTLLLTYQTLEDIDQYGKVNKDSDTLYMLLQGINNVEVIALVREESPGECSVGLRSNSNIDVGKIALENGGGGHAKAAGYSRAGDRKTVSREIISQLAEYLQ